MLGLVHFGIQHVLLNLVMIFTAYKRVNSRCVLRSTNRAFSFVNSIVSIQFQLSPVTRCFAMRVKVCCFLSRCSLCCSGKEVHRRRTESIEYLEELVRLFTGKAKTGQHAEVFLITEFYSRLLNGSESILQVFKRRCFLSTLRCVCFKVLVSCSIQHVVCSSVIAFFLSRFQLGLRRTYCCIVLISFKELVI